VLAKLYICSVRVLFVSDSHIGFDTVRRARIARRRRGDDFLAMYRLALEPALKGEVDAVVHGGDVFDHPNVRAGDVDDAFRPLRAIAERGCPVFVVAGNHERSSFPFPLLARHPGIHLFTQPRTVAVRVAGLTLAVGAFAYQRRIREAFVPALQATALLQTTADVRLLVVHHCIEGAVVSNPSGDFRFRSAPDVIRRRDLPGGVAAVLSGHIHRHQVIPPHGGEASAPAVCYPGSVERTSLVERDETKGYMILELSPEAERGRLDGWSFHPLPARPMRLCRLHEVADVNSVVGDAIEAAPRDAVLHFRAHDALREHRSLKMAQLRGRAPASMNVTLSFESPRRDPSTGKASGRPASGQEAPTRRELRRAAFG
jgi:DNA repair protein SbcD/Mre11